MSPFLIEINGSIGTQQVAAPAPAARTCFVSSRTSPSLQSEPPGCWWGVQLPNHIHVCTLSLAPAVVVEQAGMAFASSRALCRQDLCWWGLWGQWWLPRFCQAAPFWPDRPVTLEPGSFMGWISEQLFHKHTELPSLGLSFFVVWLCWGFFQPLTNPPEIGAKIEGIRKQILS